MPRPHLAPEEALELWHLGGTPGGPLGVTLRPAPDAGLINETWFVDRPEESSEEPSPGADREPVAVLQWLNPITHPAMHLDVAALTARLRGRGMTTPELIPTADGRLWLDDDAHGCWRVWTYVPGTTLHRLETPAQAAAAGDLVGRFHVALAGWDHEFQAPRRNIHHTPSRMAELERAVAECPDHPLASAATELAESISEAWGRWREDGRLDLPERPCHGDLKISNLRFTETQTEDGVRGVCLLDLDTLGPQTLAAEMGDAWRSWCNPAGEEEPEAVRFDFGLFAASARAWAVHWARLRDEVSEEALSPEEVASLVPGIERICLELSARFCADALRNSYFRENRDRFPEPGRHNLVRATSQHRLAERAREVRGRCEDLLGELFGGSR